MKLPSWSLRSVLPRLEIDWLLPFWLLVAILAAAAAEIVTIGNGVERVYGGLKTGWLIGGVVASSQAMGSMMWARASQHNAGKRKSAPSLSIFWPALISILSGVVSGWVGLYLYQQSELTGLGRALAVASPAGSIAAAVLNGVFASGEAAIAEYEEQRGQRRKPTKPSEPEAKLEPALRCWCGKEAGSQNALNAHSRIHLREVREASSVAVARELLESKYPNKTLPEAPDIARMRRKATNG